MQADQVIQSVFPLIKKLSWRDCEDNSGYQWYYAEDCHYIIKDKSTDACWFVKAKSPSNAYSIVSNKTKGENNDGN